MDEVTVSLGKSLRDFQEKTCSAFDTRELRREAGARMKRKAKAAAQNSEKSKDNPNPPVLDTIPPTLETTTPMELEPTNLPNTNGQTTPPMASTAGKKRKRTRKAATATGKGPVDRLERLKKPLSLNTYKNHAIGDYTDAIRKYGTTDSYSTERVFKFDTFQESFNRYFIL